MTNPPTGGPGGPPKGPPAAPGAFTRPASTYRQAQQVYERVVVLKPNDAAAQRELGYAAFYAGDSATATTAFQKFLKLAPDDPEAPLIKQQLKQIKQSAAATPSTTAPASSSG